MQCCSSSHGAEVYPIVKGHVYRYCAQVRVATAVLWCKQNIAAWPNNGVWTFRLIGHREGTLQVRIYTNAPEHHALVQLNWGGAA